MWEIFILSVTFYASLFIYKKMHRTVIINTEKLYRETKRFIALRMLITIRKRVLLR